MNAAGDDGPPELPNEALNALLGWIDNDANELADDALVKLTDAAGRAITHVTAGWWKQFITATNGTRFGDCERCGRAWGAHTYTEERACTEEQP